MSSIAKELQKLDEQHDYVNVQHQGSKNVVVLAKLMSTFTNDELSVKDQVKTIYHTKQPRDERAIPGPKSHEPATDSNQNCNHEQDEEESTAHCEVSLCRACIKGKCKSYTGSHQSCCHHIGGRVERCCAANHEGEAASENEEKNVVEGNFTGDMLAAKESALDTDSHDKKPD